MTGLLLQIGATKLAVSIVLVAAVWMVHRTVDRPTVSYQLWLMVLLTLLVPTVVSLPVLPMEPVAALTTPPVGTLRVELAEPSADPVAGRRFVAFLQPGLAILWLGGTAALLGWTAVRTIRFRRTLKRAMRPSPAWLQRQAAAVGRDLGLTRIPELCTTSARVTPMVWWSGGKVRMLIPSFLLTDPGSEELRAILAHELAHVRRHDHLVRWLEWLACSVFWWNPVAWCARYHLRLAEESCCDELAVGVGRACPKAYAKALLRVVANASEPPGFRPPLPASAVGGVGHTQSLEKRIRMIVSTDTRPPTPRWVRTASRVAVVCALPFGLIYCDRTTAANDETSVDPTEGGALDSPDELPVGMQEFAYRVSRSETEVQELIREAMESGSISERRGRELSAYVTGAASGRLIRYSLDHDVSEQILQAVSDSLIAGAVERNRGLWLGDYSTRISTSDYQSPVLEAALAEMLELIGEIERTPERNGRPEDWKRRIRELNARIHAAIGPETGSQE